MKNLKFDEFDMFLGLLDHCIIQMFNGNTIGKPIRAILQK